ncbi:hypothetical protein VTN00DRAFT_1574 [Thermoascus crustaceus]|uniref:uncharacterized protein n=1 Tax=Thermoascus crustaceus TaxID=5088 RepID=UPI003742275E
MHIFPRTNLLLLPERGAETQGEVSSRIPEPELFRGCPWALASRPALPPAAGKARRQGSARDRLGASARYRPSALHHIKAPWRRLCTALLSICSGKYCKTRLARQKKHQRTRDRKVAIRHGDSMLPESSGRPLQSLQANPPFRVPWMQLSLFRTRSCGP